MWPQGHSPLWDKRARFTVKGGWFLQETAKSFGRHYVRRHPNAPSSPPTMLCVLKPKPGASGGKAWARHVRTPQLAKPPRRGGMPTKSPRFWGHRLSGSFKTQMETSTFSDCVPRTFEPACSKSKESGCTQPERSSTWLPGARAAGHAGSSPQLRTTLLRPPPPGRHPASSSPAPVCSRPSVRGLPRS